MRRLFLILLVCGVSCGCIKLKQLAHLQPLLTLKASSDNRDEQAKYVQAQDAKFEKLLEAVKAGRVSEYPDQKKIAKEFGAPVFERAVERSGRIYELWLYRYATKYFDSEKVYLYFDEKGELKDWEHYTPPVKEQVQENSDHNRVGCCQ